MIPALSFVRRLLAAPALLTVGLLPMHTTSRVDERHEKREGRRLVHVTWKGQWMRGGNKEETLFGMPREIVASKDGLYVADGGGLEVIAFAPDGRTRWKVGRKGGGPGEFQHLEDITFDANGDVAVLDPFNARITIMGKAGELRRTISTGAVPWVDGICLGRDGSVSALTSSTKAFVTVLDSAGRVRQTRAFPWKTPANAPSFLRSAHFARGLAADRCWLATTFGFGIASSEGAARAGALLAMPYVETVPAPVIRTEPSTTKKRGGQYLERGDNAALAAFTSGDTLFVHFMGKQDRTKPLLDLYDAGGRYLESWTLPERMERVAYANGVLYTLSNTMEAAIIIAWKRVEPPPAARSPAGTGVPAHPR